MSTRGSKAKLVKLSSFLLIIGKLHPLPSPIFVQNYKRTRAMVKNRPLQICEESSILISVACTKLKIPLSLGPSDVLGLLLHHFPCSNDQFV